MNDALRNLDLAELERLLEQAEEAGLQEQPRQDLSIPRADRGAPLPLSFAQQRLWFLTQLDSPGQTYHMPLGLHLAGALDRAALARSLDRVVERHEALRTTFSARDGQPVQCIAPADSGFALREHDLRGRTDPRAEAHALAAEEAAAPFDLERGPLIRGRLLLLGDEEHVLLITMHHIVSDGWSMGVLMQEISALYGADVRGRPDPLPPLAVQYADYAAWQHRAMDDAEVQRLGDFWQRALADAPALLPLPADRPRPPQQDHRGAVFDFELDASLTAGLKALAQRHGLTLYMTLLAGWAALMGRLAGQDDVVIGTPAANRNRVEIEGLIGFFINTLALRIDLRGDPGVREILQRVRTVSLEAQRNQELPFEQIVELVKPVRSLSHSPIFQVVFSWQNNAKGRLELPGLEVTPVGVSQQTAKVDLTLNLGESDDRIVGGIEYATALFDHATVGRYAGHLRTVLRAMVADDTQAFHALPLLDAAQREQLLLDWNATDLPYPADRCVHELFEAHAAATPLATALVRGGERLSYGELDAQANRLAHFLRDLGVGPDVRVAICADRRPHLVVGLLAVLKAGGAFVPLDPAYPRERLDHMLADSDPAVVLVDALGEQALSGNGHGPRLLLDAQETPWADAPADALPPQDLGLAPSHLAYVIYTSGSTGVPKGVMVEHRSVCNLSTAQTRAYAVDPDSRVLQFASISFDACVWETVMALCHGAALHLPDADTALVGPALVEMVRTHRITHATLPPAVLTGLGDDPADDDALASLRTLIVAGEAPTTALVRRWAPGRLFINAYGPTETTVCATMHVCDPADPIDTGVPPIGRPIANTRVYLLDANRQPVPVGVPGELYVGGASVARGYLNQPELTAQRFPADPFDARHGGRMYRTGDLARWRADGSIEFLGRNDFQVKVRGVRIELGEIEARLADHPGVREALVVAVDAQADRRLIAYYTRTADTEVGAAELSAHLARALPEFMVPAAFVALDAFPLTGNGKIDRKALPDPDGSSVVRRGDAPPEGEHEQALARVWSELLQIDRVGRHDDFFELGGHSLLAVRLTASIRRELGVELSLATLFAQPTLAAMATAVADARRSDLPPIVPAPRGGRLPMSFAQQRMWFLAQLEGVGATYHMPMGLQLTGPLDRTVLKSSLDRLVARHEALRSTFHVEDGEAYVELAPPNTGFALREHDLRAEADAQAALQRLVAQEMEAPFDLETSPLVRGSLIRLADDDHVLLIDQHHIVSDAWSMAVFTRELSALYGAGLEGGADPLPPLAIQYPDYAAWQRSAAVAERSARHADYWKTTLAGAPTLLDLPTDRPRPAQQDFAGAFVPLEIDADLAHELRTLSRQQGTTLLATVAAAWSIVLSRLSGQRDLVLGTVTANRGRGEVEGLIGFFVNSLALRIDLRDGPGTHTLVRQVGATLLGAQEHEDLPFEQVVELVQPARSLAHSPLFQAVIAWNNAGAGEPAFPGLQVRTLGGAADAAKFDLTLIMSEAGERLVGRLGYATALFDAATIERQAGYLVAALRALVMDEQPVDGIELLPTQERRQLLAQWNATDAPFDETLCVHKLFEAQAARTPDAPAVEQDGVSLSYAELNAQANRLAHFLRDLGVGPDVRVALCLQRQPCMVVGLLAVLKAGGAYVPLDPAAPRDRLAQLLADSDPRAVLVDAAGARATQQVDLPCFALDDAEPPWRGHPAGNPSADEVELTPAHLAYVIYTSGSTGRPKGVLVVHRGVVNYLQWAIGAYAPAVAARSIVSSALGFDATVTSLLAPLLCGGSVRLLAEGAEIEGLLREVRQAATPTLFKLTPAHLQALSQAAQGAQDTSGNVSSGVAHLYVVGGEALSGTTVRQLRRLNPAARIINEYGPTETVVGCVVHALEPGSPAPDAVPIGRPIANTRIYLLDDQGRPVPLGAAGEIHIGGAGVARGYLNRPEVTAERFVRDPFDAAPGATLYRTGDLARYRADGVLEYLGRNDFQIKLRGFRIEPGEIEARLAEHDGVDEAVVVARDGDGEKRLVAYVVPSPDTAPVLRELLRIEQDDPAVASELHELDNGLPVFHRNKRETGFLYADIFKDSEYAGHGLALADDSCVFDVGANIGMFSVFMARQFPDATLYAFEPIGALFRTLSLNRRLHGIRGEAFNVGLSNEARLATFRFYPNNTAVSTSAVSHEDTREIVRGFVDNQVTAMPAAGALDVGDVLDTQLTYEEQACPLRRLSDVIAEQGVERIDLLKVDVEGAELDVLLGIDDGDWPKIGQLVIEVHDVEGRLHTITALLERQGFAVTVDQLASVRNTALYNLYAVHPRRRPGRTIVADQAKAPAAGRWDSRAHLVRDLRAHLSRALPDYMLPSAFVVVDAFALTANGKLDRQALPDPDGAALVHRVYEPPQGETELALARLWSDVLKVERVGRGDHFFELGGHSLLALQLLSRVQRDFAVALTLAPLFEHPTLAALAQVIDGAAGDALPPIPVVSREGRLPLSLAQQRLWFLAQLDASSPVYHIPLGLRLQGALDRRALRASLDRLLARHEALRSSFDSHDGQPGARLAPPDVGFALTETDLRGDADGLATARRIAAQETSTPFDLARGPLIRGRLLRLADDDHVLLVTMHHIVADGWSMGVLTRELGALYGAFARGQADPLPPLPIQYVDYAAWQRGWLDGAVLQAQSSYWQQRLHSAPEVLDLPLDRPRAPRQDHRGASYEVALDAPLSARLRALSRAHGVTPYMTLLAAWAALLGRLSGQDDVVIGTPAANRTRVEIEGLIGFFINTLALRIDLAGAPSTVELLQRVKAESLAAQQHQDLPFEQVVELVKPVRSLAHTPLFQSMFTWHNSAPAAFELPGLQLQMIGADHGIAKFDLSLSLSEAGERIVGGIEYSTALFDRETIARIAGAFDTLLHAMVDDALNAIERLALLTDAQQRALLVECSGPDLALDGGELVHRRIEAHAAARPHASAVLGEQGELSYAALNAAANRLAHHLVGLGVGADTRVGICMDRGLDMVVAVLAVLKAGGAYVPLDPAYPVDRLDHMLADSAPAVLLTAGAVPAGLRTASAAVLDMLGDAHRWQRQPDTNPDPAATGLTPSHLAYVIYTSGSTGTARGVMVEHRTLAASTRARTATYGEDGRFLLLSSLSFDSSVAGLFGTLASGGTLCVPRAELVLAPAALRSAIQAWRIDSLLCVPSLLQVILEDAHHDELHDELASLRHVIVAGEACPPALPARLAAIAPQAALYNEYGPTEATVWATVHRCAPSAGTAAVPIGRPIANTRVYVLDAHRRPQPAGVAGELYIGGAGVARGYLNRPELTAERFIDDPFHGGRMYKTGDLGRYRADGAIEFLGRNDFQVKIRGFRIEPGDIEAALAQLAGVREAAVVAKEDSPGEKHLVACVVADQGTDAETLRTQLARTLPDYMVPTAWVLLERMPLTPNGKVDRKALAGLQARTTARPPYEAPQGDTEILLAQLWGKLLKVPQVGRHDDFFVLGGHSLLAVRLASRLRAALGIDFELDALFEHTQLLAQAQALGAAQRNALPPVELASRDAALPLSFAQQRLWFLAQLDADSRAYHMPLGLHLSGRLDRAALQRTLDRIVARHEALRTAFVLEQGSPVQRIAAADTGFTLRVHDLRGHADVRAEAEALAVQEAGEVFDLATGPLIRGRLLVLGDAEHVLLVTMHHIVSDGWSMGVLTQELSALYAAFAEGRDDPLPPLPIQYADYAAWQRRWLDGEVLQRQSEHWKQRLDGAPPLLELPTDRPRPAQQDHRGATAGISLDEELSAGLKALAQRHGATLHMTLLSAWAALLGRLSGQDDVVIGTPVANRTRVEFEGLIGFFINTLALRLDLGGNPSTTQLLQRVRTEALAAQQHQDLPFEQVVDLVKPARSLSHTPLFQVLFSWQNNAGGELALPGLQLRPVGAPHTISKFDMTLSLGESDGRIGGGIEYAKALFDAATVERHLRHYRRLLQAMVDDENRAVAQLELLDAAERAQLLVEWNATEAEYPHDACVHELFEAQVQRTPAAVAVVQGEQQLTYAALDTESNRLAHFLRDLGVGPDTRVAVCMERRPYLLTGLLAVLKAGGAYVPLDIGSPRERLASLLADCDPAVVLVDAAGAKVLGDGIDAPCIALDTETPAWADAPTGRPDVDLRPEHLAYVIYTSGSTGMPKGVMVEHRGVVNYLCWAAQAYQAGRGAVVSSSLSFDATVTSLWAPLVQGGTVRLLTEGQEVEGLEAQVQSSDGGLVKITPAHLDVLGQRLLAQNARSTVGVFVVGGEALAPSTVALWQRLQPGVRIVNEYGPTETVVGCIVHDVPENADPGRTVPIGRPIANTRIYVLDTNGQPAPIGVPGEIFIGGDGVARGYLNRPELTAERFLDDPFHAGGRMYKTGDLARYRADGTLDYLGRNDFQVKIRGFRIEPGEIEAKLAQLAGVREAAVLAREDNPGDKRLVAYVVGDETVDAASLRAQLARLLPEYMVPSAYVLLDALPLTPNGKLDRRALPAPDGLSLAAPAYEQPQGEAETQLARIWSELLHVERIGRHDDFFALGGHSLLAMRLLSQLRTDLGVEFPLGKLFEHPILWTQAAALEGAQRSELPPIVPVPRTDAGLPLSFAQQRLWFLAQLDGQREAYHIPLGLHLAGTLDRAALRRALDTIVARHEALRTVFALEDGQPVQRIADAGAGFPLAMHDLRGHADARAEAEALVASEAAAAFDLAQGPLVRGRLLVLGDTDHVLLVTMHHIVSDGWSMGVFNHELSALYAAFTEGRPDPLPPLPIQYADYAAWQRRWLDGEALRRQGDYWKRRLDIAPALLELPTDRPRPPHQDYRGALAGFELEAPLSAALKALSLRHGTTLYMTMLAAWAALLGRLSGQDDLVIGTPVANRTRTEVEGLIGFFVGTLALRMDLGGSPSTVELLQRVKAESIAAQQQQDLPFEQVVDIVKPARSMSHTPLFQVLFSWRNNAGGELELPGLQARPVGAPHTISKFDMTLSVGEADGRIGGGIEYATALFDAATIERHLAQYRRLLQAMVDDENRQVGRLELLDAAEREQLLVEWNATEAEYPREMCVHELFEAQILRTPAAVAVVQGEQTVTYAALDAEANRLAHFLRDLGVGPDTRVAVCMERKPYLLTGLLAVLKAGGAYVPLDIGSPRERLASLLADCDPAVVLVDAAGAKALGDGIDAPCIALDTETPAWADAPTDRPDVDLRPDHLAYVIYTSGSTGMPKGVMVEHRGVVNYLCWAAQAYQAGRGAVVSSSLSFDATVTSLWAPLVQGGTVRLLTEGQEVEGLEAQVQSSDGGLVKITPAHLDVLGQRLLAQNARSTVGVFVVGGEALAPSTVALWQRLQPGVRIVNEYGPTETVVGCIVHDVPENADPGRTVPIGRPIANTRIYVLDTNGQPAPIGVPGEIFIGGDGVARGYLNRPELTAERFLDDPFHAGGRMYKTGDLARYRADGTLDYLGRNDFQVKVRGFRIEPGEVEAKLAQLAGVREAAVLAREDNPGDKRLVAYVVGDDTVDAASLRAQLARLLPEYMVPSAYVLLDALPLTPNGKLDRKALPAPDAQAFAGAAYEAPRGDIETALAGLWSELLHAERIGRHDDFFALGGHSLLAVRLLSRVREALGVEVPLGQLFEHPRLQALADVVAGAARSELPAIRRVSRDEPLPLSFAQQRLWFLAQLAPESRAYHIPLGLRLSGPLDHAALRRTLDRIVARHEALRTVFALEGGQPVQRIAPPDTGFTLHMQDLRAGPGADTQVKALAAREAVDAFDLSTGPLIRGRLLVLGDTDHVLLVTMHHIVSDGWSMDVLTGELRALYAAFAEGRDDPLPALPIQYADYAAWQRRWLDGEVLQRQSAYWKDRLAGAPALLELPVDHPRPAQQDHRGGFLAFALEAPLAAGLQALSQRHGTTLYMTLLAAWAALLARLSGQDDVVIGTPVANRGRMELEGLIGFFVNTLALRVELGGSPSTVELLQRVKAESIAAQQHQDLPFEQVVDLLKPVRSMAHTPLFQAMFSWQTGGAQGAADHGTAAADGLTLRPLSAPATLAKFDLTLHMGEAGGHIAGGFEYASALFEQETIERFRGHFLVLLRAMVAEEQRPVAELPMLSDAERQRLLVEWNTTEVPAAGDCVHALFEAQALRTPDAVALVHGDQHLSYAELDAQANRLAHHLRTLGVGPDERVAVCVQRSERMVVALLAVLKAGGGYVPLDPAYPAERLTYMLHDSEPRVLIIDGELPEGLADGLSLPVLDLQADAGLWTALPSTPVPAASIGLRPEHLAYVIYTSGST
ncbi:MAG: non-ribosomal peptide synthase/polyketide synthase, partial [Pseudomonadota bacterium]